MEHKSNTQLVNKFKEEYPNLPYQITKNIIVEVVENIYGLLQPRICINDITTGEDIRQAIPNILYIRDAIRDFQDKKGIYTDHYLLYKLSEDHRKNKIRYEKIRKVSGNHTQYGYATYKQITMAVNEYIEEVLYLLDGKEYEKKQESRYIKTLKTYLTDQPINDMDQIKDLLKTFRMQEEKIENNLGKCFDLVSKGKFPSEENFPLSQRKLKDAIRWIRGTRR